MGKYLVTAKEKDGGQVWAVVKLPSLGVRAWTDLKEDATRMSYTSACEVCAWLARNKPDFLETTPKVMGEK